MWGRVSTLESSPQDAKASKRKEADALPAVEDGNFPVSSVLFERRLALVMNAVFFGDEKLTTFLFRDSFQSHERMESLHEKTIRIHDSILS